jgi:thiamine-monophosphate kinase
MGGVPRWALVSLALPPSLETAWVDDFYRGLDAALGEFGAVVIGGNLSGSEAIIVDVTLLGEVARESLLTRAGARPGDLVLVTGTLGRAATGRAALDAGLEVDEPDAELAEVLAAHQTPTPRVREGQALAVTGGVTAMMDISDGLAGDLAHILDASGVGVLVQAAHLPISPATLAVCERLNLDPITLALSGGEDFELLFTAAPDAVDRLRALVEDQTGTPLTVIGEIRPPAEGRRLVLPGGAERRLTAAGWDHFRPT